MKEITCSIGYHERTKSRFFQELFSRSLAPQRYKNVKGVIYPLRKKPKSREEFIIFSLYPDLISGFPLKGISYETCHKHCSVFWPEEALPRSYQSHFHLMGLSNHKLKTHISLSAIKISFQSHIFCKMILRGNGCPIKLYQVFAYKVNQS